MARWRFQPSYCRPQYFIISFSIPLFRDSTAVCCVQDGKPQAPRQPLRAVKYQEVHTTFVRGTVDPAYFGLGKGEKVPSSVLLTEAAADVAFSSLALKTWVGDPSDLVGLYKLFSRYLGMV